MGLKLWKKQRVLRRYIGQEIVNGYEVVSHEDMMIYADVQTTDQSTTTGLDGDMATQRIKVFTDTKLRVARDNLPGDRIWFQDRWFECRTSRLSENTFLKHWTSTFVECMNQEAAPVVLYVTNGRLHIESEDVYYKDGRIHIPRDIGDVSDGRLTLKGVSL